MSDTMTPAPAFTNLDHVTIVITDWDRAIAFYRDVLGLREIAIPDSFPGARVPVRWFAIGNQFIHLYNAPAADPPSPRHFAIHIADITAARDYFSRKGVATSETVVIDGADRFFISDPDGNRIEVIHWDRPYKVRAV
jgi:catechol 2,3-dioxygenase-like lactoylglutathione lyase family enzyme